MSFRLQGRDHPKRVNLDRPPRRSERKCGYQSRKAQGAAVTCIRQVQDIGTASGSAGPVLSGVSANRRHAFPRSRCRLALCYSALDRQERRSIETGFQFLLRV